MSPLSVYISWCFTLLYKHLHCSLSHASLTSCFPPSHFHFKPLHPSSGGAALVPSPCLSTTSKHSYLDQVNFTPPLDISLWELCQNPIIFRMRKLQNAHRRYGRLLFLSFLVLTWQSFHIEMLRGWHKTYLIPPVLPSSRVDRSDLSLQTKRPP